MSTSKWSPLRQLVAVAVTIVTWIVVWVLGNAIFGFEADRTLAFSFLSLMLAGTIVVWVWGFSSGQVSKLHRKAVRFRLSTLLVGITAICIAAGWSTWAVQRSQKRRILLTDFQRRGGVVNQLYSSGGSTFEFLIPPEKFNEEEVEQLHSAFPDARFSEQRDDAS